MKVVVKPFDESMLPAFDDLLDRDQASRGCWCTWFIIPVTQYHSGGAAANRTVFEDLMRSDKQPVGLSAWNGEEMVGWCAAGPRRRYARAIKTPTYGSRNAAEDEHVWLVPCFLVRPDHRDQGVASALLGAAVDIARQNGAKAVEAFPLAGPGRKSGRDMQVGVEPLFAAHGFQPVRRPSPNRVMMRLELG